MDLRLWLQERDRNSFDRVMSIRRTVEPILKQALHRDYTDHTIDHSERVINKLNDLTEALTSSNGLSPTEAYILLAAAYVHDLGMQDELSGGDDLKSIRDRHEELTRARVSQWVEQLGPLVGLLFADAEIGDLVSHVAKAHRGVVDLSDAIYDEYPHGDEILRPRLLGALLRFADELDIDHRRAPRNMLTLRKLPSESLYHWYKCHYVSGVKITDEYVVVWFRFPEGHADYGHFIMPLVNGKIQATLDELQSIFWEHGIKPGLGRPQAREINGLESMPPAVEAFAREQCITRYEQDIDVGAQGISFIRSLSVQELRVAHE